MSGKHSLGQLGLPRYSFIAAAATLLVILVAWVAVRAAGPTADQSPILVVPPSTPVVEAGVAALPSTIPIASPPASPSATPTPTPSRTPSASPTPSRTSAVPKTPKPKPTTKPAPVRTTPPAAAAFSASYGPGPSWDQGFIGSVQVTNTGRAAGTWRVSISYSSRAGVRITNAWNAQVSQSGNTWTFTADNLAPGAQVNFGFQAMKQSRGPVSPTGCTVNGTPCRTG